MIVKAFVHPGLYYMQRQVCIANVQAIAKIKVIIANLKGNKKIIQGSCESSVWLICTNIL